MAAGCRTAWSSQNPANDHWTVERKSAARARSDCRLVPINEKRFLFLIQQTPFFALQVMRIISERLRRQLGEVAGRMGSF